MTWITNISVYWHKDAFHLIMNWKTPHHAAISTLVFQLTLTAWFFLYGYQSISPHMWHHLGKAVDNRWLYTCLWSQSQMRLEYLHVYIPNFWCHVPALLSLNRTLEVKRSSAGRSAPPGSLDQSCQREKKMKLLNLPFKNKCKQTNKGCVLTQGRQWCCMFQQNPGRPGSTAQNPLECSRRDFPWPQLLGHAALTFS